MMKSHKRCKHSKRTALREFSSSLAITALIIVSTIVLSTVPSRAGEGFFKTVSTVDWREIARQYAPIVYLDKGESYFPASPEWAFPNFQRININNKYCLKTKQKLSTPSSVLAFFHGEKEAITSGKEVPAYAFINFLEKSKDKAVDINYFFYYPYNRGKNACMSREVSGHCLGKRTVIGNHVSDWATLSIRFDVNGNPWYVYVSTHNFGAIYSFSDGRFLRSDKTSPDRAAETQRKSTLQFADTPPYRRPIVYAAQGSHEFWVKPGVLPYKYIKPTGETLVEYTSKGYRWDTAKKLFVYNYNDETDWPSWMRDPARGCIEEGCDPNDPWSGGIYRWGNKKSGCAVLESLSGECRLNDGPTGPAQKSVWSGQNFVGSWIPDHSSYITAVRVVKNVKGLLCPPGFEGLHYGEATRPNQFQRRANDVNKNMGGDSVGICVEYTAADECDKFNRKVLTDIEVKHWPNWKARCPAGWEKVGPLTTHTRGPCDRMGLCAQYTDVGDLKKKSRKAVYSIGLSEYGRINCSVNAPQWRGENIQTRDFRCGGSILYICSGSE